MRRLLRPFRAFLRLTLLLTALVAVGCGGAARPAKEPSPPTPLDEKKAVDVMARSFFNLQLDPERGRIVELAPGKNVSLEIAARGKNFGVAYLTAREESDLSVLIPQGAASSSALSIVSGPHGEHVLFLFERNYLLEDEIQGDTRVLSSAGAERKLEGDVREFLKKAQAEGWP